MTVEEVRGSLDSTDNGAVKNSIFEAAGFFDTVSSGLIFVDSVFFDLIFSGSIFLEILFFEALFSLETIPHSANIRIRT